MAKQKDSEIHWCRNSESDNPACSYRSGTDFSGSTVHKARVIQ